MTTREPVPRTKRIEVRVTRAELAGLRALAKKAGVTVSDWVRQRIRYYTHRDIERGEGNIL